MAQYTGVNAPLILFFRQRRTVFGHFASNGATNMLFFLSCLVRLGSVGFGSVGFGSVGVDSVRLGSARFGSVRFGSVRFGSVRFG